MDTNLSALADSMQFLSLGVPGISRPKKFNVNAWSTPLKSIENQPRRVAREKIYEFESTNNVDDDSLSNLSDLFPGQNFFEKTSDFIEYYRLNSPEESNYSPVSDRTGFSASAHPTCPPNESTVAGLSVSNSPSNCSRSVKRFASFSELSVNLSDDVKSHFSPPHSAEQLESPITRLNSTVSPSPLESFELDRLTLVVPKVDRSSRSPHPSNNVSARSVGHPTSPVANERRVESLESSSRSMYDGNGNDVGSGDYPTLLPDCERSSIRKRSDLSDPPIDDDNDVSGCDSTTGDDNFYLAVSHIENASCDSQFSKSGRLDSAEVVGLQWQCRSGAASDTEERYAGKGIEPISKCGDEAGVATSTDDGSPYVRKEETSVPKLDDESEIVVASSLAQPSGQLNPKEGANLSPSTFALSDRVDCSYSLNTPLVNCATSVICDSYVEPQLHSSVPSSHIFDSYSETVDQNELSADAEPSSLAQPAISNRRSNGWSIVFGAVTNGNSHRDEQTACGALSTVPQMESSNSHGLDVSDCDLSGACLTSSSSFDEKNGLARERDRVTPSLSVDSPLDVVGTKSVLDVHGAVCHSSRTSSEVDESGDADDVEEEFVAASSPLTSPLFSKTACDAVECVRRVSPDAGGGRDPTPNEKAGLSPRTRTTSPDDRTSFLAAALPMEPHRSEAGPTVGYSDHVVSHSENSAVLLSSASAEIVPSIDVFLEHNAMALAPNESLDAAKCVSVNAEDSFEDYTESQYHLTEEKRSKTPRSKCSAKDRSFVADFSDLGDSPTKENERFAEYDVGVVLKLLFKTF